MLPSSEEISGATLLPAPHRKTSTSLEFTSAAENLPLTSNSPKEEFLRFKLSSPHEAKRRNETTDGVMGMILRNFTIHLYICRSEASNSKEKKGDFRLRFLKEKITFDESQILSEKTRITFLSIGRCNFVNQIISVCLKKEVNTSAFSY